MPKLNFFDLPRAELASILEERFSLPAFRAGQLFDWVYKKEARSFAVMTNISQALRDELQEHFEFPVLKIVDRQISKDGTRKYAFGLADGKVIETVMIKQPKRMTLCVSSQVGCGMACTFCRTGTMGFIRNLAPAEIVGQVLAVLEDAKNFSDSFSNMVFMGMGEPLHNLGGVSKAIKILTDHSGLKMAGRRITVSTVGLVPAIRKFGELGLGVNLAVSLNASSDKVRSSIMPINDRYPLSELLDAIEQFPIRARDKVTLEYVMLHGVNDTAEDFKRLYQLLEGRQVKVNLIPYNENAGLGFKSPNSEWVYSWHDWLNKRGLQTTVRWSKGSDIAAACGQLVTDSVKNVRAAEIQLPAEGFA